MRSMRLYKINEIKVEKDLLSAISLSNYVVIRGGVHVYKPKEESHKGEYHVHDHPEVFIGIKGEAVMIVNGRKYRFSGGDIIVIETGEEHHVVADESNPITLVWLDVRKNEGRNSN
ncbi:MAG: hypothetical protein DRZ82_04835 [Thermoprotei archaeon]|nr:MAG: hypothetical protein DRZ82_04835 [Thermoprotei archaeon]